jgi:small-conductance mechanosensitive channel
VGSTAVIIGIASRPFLENFLSGVAITVSKKLNIGDTILIDNQYGKIEDISSTHTILKLWDWRRYVIPNSTMISHEFINYSLYDNWQWTHVEFFVSYEADLELVRELAMAAPQKSRHYADFEPPSFWIMETSRDAIKCWIAAWAESAEKAWELKGDIRTELIIQFQKHGIRTHLNQHALLQPEA